MAGFVNMTALVARPAGLVEVAKPVAVLAEIEGLAGLSVMVTLTTPLACIELNAGSVGLGVIELFTTGMDLFSAHEVSRGILEDYLQGEVVVGVGVGEGGSTVVAVFLEFKEVLLHFCNTTGRAVDVGIEGAVVHNLCLKGVVLLEVDSMVNQF